MRAHTIYETQHFTRGQDPKIAMGIGAWQNLQERAVLESKVNDDELNWNKERGHVYFEVVDVKRNVNILSRIQPTHSVDLQIYTHMFSTLYDFENATVYVERKFRGSYEQFEHSFNIIKM